MSITPQAAVDATAVPAPDARRAALAALPWGVLFGLTLILALAWLDLPLMPEAAVDGLYTVAMHTVLEFTAVVAALLVFSVAWHAGTSAQPGNILLVGCGFLAVGLIDFGHTVSFKGMPDFVTPSGSEKAIQFWLVARYAAAITLVAAAVFQLRPLTRAWQRHALLALVLALSGAAYVINLGMPAVWPRTFVDGQGLTLFKVTAEYGVIALLCVAVWGFLRHPPHDEGYSTSDLCSAAFITILSELCLTRYRDVHDLFNLMGHVYKVVAYFYIYRAVFVTSVSNPYRRLRAEVLERREAERRATFLTFHDQLTGLPNRELARDRLMQAIADARRHQTHVALVLLDLDNFKTINDSLGHAWGDRLLCHVAKLLQSQVRQSDTVCRHGGDEFLLIIKEQPDVDTVARIVGKLMDELRKPLELDGHELVTSASAGIAMAPEDGEDFDSLLQRVDSAMYRAKAEGRNTFRFCDDRMNTESMERLTLLNGLRKGLELGQFVLHYQPQVNLETGEVFGVEALIRWQHPEWGLVPPGRFIPLAEESGLIVPIGNWVIDEACRQGRAWLDQGLAPLSVAVNLSALQFRRGDVEAVVAQALERSGLPPDLLELELTESVLISDVESVQARLSSLKALGVHLAIDDFGTGYSSLSYLRRLSVDKLKIDQSFVRDLERHPEDVAIVRAILQMAASMGLKTIAEGVETRPMMQTLQTLGCKEGQGYWFAKPMPADQFEAWLAKAQPHGILSRVTEMA
ncbi:MAG: EAL domain-containing protein [Aquabacterium sp.]